MTMTTELRGSVALITGASSGIGAAVARSLSASGASVALVARRERLLGDVASSIRRGGGSAIVVPADLTEQEQAAAAVTQTVEELGRLDIVINNAGIMHLGNAIHSLSGEWEEMLDINVRGMLYVTRAALPHLLAAAADSPRGVADLVNINSLAGKVARPGSSVYNLTKFGGAAFSEALRQELVDGKVRVSVVLPGTVDTDLLSHVREPMRTAAQLRASAIECLRPEDIADAVSYIVTRDRRVAVNEMVIRAGEQTW
jgi:NADP-dependent 3-hydroxy acid dehydrogenase YdfG